MMDDRLATLVRLMEDMLDDCDQFTDTPDHPNYLAVWAVREVLEDFGGTRHRWSHPRCFVCDHTYTFHRGNHCDLCDCEVAKVRPSYLTRGGRWSVVNTRPQ